MESIVKIVVGVVVLAIVVLCFVQGMDFVIDVLVPSMVYVVPAVAGLALITHFGSSALSDPKSLLKTFGMFAILILVFFVIYSISSGDMPTWMKDAKYAEWQEHTVWGLDFKKVLGAGIMGTLALMAIGVVLTVLLELGNLFK